MTDPTDTAVSKPAGAPRHVAERALERTLFASRWLLAPIYLGLSVCLIVILVKFARQLYHLFSRILVSEGNEVIVEILSLIDISLMANLLLMVIFAGYESFVSRLNATDHSDHLDRGRVDSDRLEWMGQIGFGDLKLKLLASIVAISAIQLLEGFMKVGQVSDRELGWLVGIHVVFVVSGVLLALMDRLSSHS